MTENAKRATRPSSNKIAICAGPTATCLIFGPPLNCVTDNTMMSLIFSFKFCFYHSKLISEIVSNQGKLTGEMIIQKEHLTRSD